MVEKLFIIPQFQRKKLATNLLRKIKNEWNGRNVYLYGNNNNSLFFSESNKAIMFANKTMDENVPLYLVL